MGLFEAQQNAMYQAQSQLAMRQKQCGLSGMGQAAAAAFNTIRPEGSSNQSTKPTLKTFREELQHETDEWLEDAT